MFANVGSQILWEKTLPLNKFSCAETDISKEACVEKWFFRRNCKDNYAAKRELGKSARAEIECFYLF